MDLSNLPESTKDLILGGLLYFQGVRQQYLAIMKGKTSTLLDSTVNSSPYADVERTIKLFIAADIKSPHQAIVKRLIDNIKLLPPANMSYKTSLISLLTRLSNKDAFSEQLCEKQLQEVSKFALVLEATAELKQMKSVPQIREVLNDLDQRLGKTSRPGKLRFYDPVQSARELMKHRDKTPTGISFIDTLLGGGITWGEHGGCLGPPSGGKSQLANMLTCNIAIQGFNTMLLQFEQSVESNSDIMSRIYSYLTGLPMSAFVNKDYSELDEATCAALDKCAKVSSRIRVSSFVDNKEVDKSVKAIIEGIDDNINGGFMPRFVVIDWLGSVVSNFMGVGSGDNKQYPLVAQQVQDELISYGTSKGISFFFLHQLSNEAAKKPSGYQPTMHDSYYFGGFAQKLEYCLQLGTKNKVDDGTFALWLGCGKVRGAEPYKYTVVKMNGQYARLEATKEGEYVISKGQLVSANSLVRVAGDSDGSTYSGGDMDAFVRGYSK